jgi:hypothetical protein
MVDGIAQSVRKANKAYSLGVSLLGMKAIVDGIAEPVRMAMDAYSLGVSSPGMEAMVDGIAESIRWAHEAIQPGSIFIRYGCHGSGVHQEVTRGHTAWEYLHHIWKPWSTASRSH